MTTKVDKNGSNRKTQSFFEKDNVKWFWVIAVFLGLIGLVVTAVIILPIARCDAGNQSAFDVMGVRYQGLADKLIAQDAALQQGWQTTADRYQGMADFVYVEREGQLQNYWDATSAALSGNVG
jgi:hypothetical protein